MILVLSAPKRSGKDEVAAILKKQFGYQRVAFADPLRVLCANTFQLPLDSFTDDTKKDLAFAEPVTMRIAEVERLAELVNADEIETQLLMQHGRDLTFNTPREIMQIVGTDLVRACVNESYFINIALDNISKAEGNIAITDARTPGERAAIKALGGTLIRIKREGYEGVGHISETSIGSDNEYDVIINNDGTLSELQHDVVMWHTLRFK